MRLIAFALIALATTGALAQELEPARVPVDRDAIDAAWSQAYQDHFDSGVAIPFTPPTIADIPDTEFGEMVRDGMQAFNNPAIYARDYVGNQLACTNCHLDSGRRPFAAPMWGAYPVYPKFRGKNHQVNTMEMRVQGCFRYSMNGTPPPADSNLMKSYIAYFSWLSQGAPIGVRPKGASFYKLDDPPETASIERGAEAYEQYCETCHQSDGQGVKHAGRPGYQFPPLWGPNSYNWGAGMHSPSKAAAFIKRNMPFGLVNVLTDQQAWDIAYFMNSHERPQDPRFKGDIQETRAKFHKGKHNLYGVEVNGQVLGEAAY